MDVLRDIYKAFKIIKEKYDGKFVWFGVEGLKPNEIEEDTFKKYVDNNILLGGIKGKDFLIGYKYHGTDRHNLFVINTKDFELKSFGTVNRVSIHKESIFITISRNEIGITLEIKVNIELKEDYIELKIFFADVIIEKKIEV